MSASTKSLPAYMRLARMMLSLFANHLRPMRKLSTYFIEPFLATYASTAARADVIRNGPGLCSSLLLGPSPSSTSVALRPEIFSGAKKQVMGKDNPARELSHSCSWVCRSRGPDTVEAEQAHLSMLQDSISEALVSSPNFLFPGSIPLRFSCG